MLVLAFYFYTDGINGDQQCTQVTVLCVIRERNYVNISLTFDTEVCVSRISGFRGGKKTRMERKSLSKPIM